MIRQLRLSDVPSQLLPGRLGGQDLAYSHAELAAPAHQIGPIQLARWSLAASRARHALAAVRGGRLSAVSMLQARGGPKAWEVAHLYATGRGTEDLDDLLERSVSYVGSRGGERLFLRVEYRSPIQELAQRTGFVPAFTEEVFALGRPMTAETDPAAMMLRPPLPADGYGLFRLYNAALPSAVRAASGLTLEQWQDAREQPKGASREYIWEQNDQVRGWIRFDHKGDRVTIDAVLHPDESSAATTLTDVAGRMAWRHAAASWVVPSYQPSMSLALQHRGWKLQRTYAVLIRSAVRPVEEPAFMPARA